MTQTVFGDSFGAVNALFSGLALEDSLEGVAGFEITSLRDGAISAGRAVI